MKQIRSASSSRHTAPAFVILSGLEQIQLRKLPWIARVLFYELIGLANFVTGRIDTSYAVLEALLDFDAAPAARDVTKPSTQRVRTALDDLVALGLVRVDRIKNEKAKGLFLKVKSRAGISASENRRNRQSNRPLDDANLAVARPAAGQTQSAQQTEQQGVQEKRFNPLTPSLSTGAEAPLDVRELAAKTKAAISKKRTEARGASTDRAPRSGSTR